MPRSREKVRYATTHLMGNLKNVSPQMRECRDILYRNFSNQIGLLLESKRPRQQHSFRGRLDTRRAYRTPFTDIVFHKNISNPSSDTTIVMLIDGSGSMCSSIELFGKPMSRMDGCNVVCSAFCKAVNDVLGNQVKVEVFVKSSPDVMSEGVGCKDGAFVTLTRAFSNVTKHKQNPDNLMSLRPMSPIEVDGEDWGSTTPEYAIIPALVQWMKKNVQTKNIVLLNMTDGEAYSSIGATGFTFRNNENKQMRIKYLRGLSNLTLFVGRDLNRKDAEDIYGTNIVCANDDTFVNKMFGVLLKEIGASL